MRQARDLHDQRYRIGQQRHPEVHEESQDLSERAIGPEAHLHGNPGSIEEMDSFHSTLEASP